MLINYLYSVYIVDKYPVLWNDRTILNTLKCATNGIAAKCKLPHYILILTIRTVLSSVSIPAVIATP